MGFNFTGLTIDKNFDRDPDKVMEFLGMNLTYVGEIDFESGSGYKDGEYVDVFFSEKGTSIYTFEPTEFEPKSSENCSVLSYMVSEIAMTFFMALDKNGVRIREVVDHEGDIQNIIGEQLNVEKDEDLMEAIIKQKEKMFGLNFYQIPIETKGYRYQVSNDSREDIYKAPFYDSNSMASNPGKMSLNFLQWIKMNFLSVFKSTFLLILAFTFMVKAHWLFGLVFIGSLLYNIWYWFTVYNKFKAGDVNPGKVISVNPDIIAVATNMAKYGGNYPVLKIVKTKLPKEEKEIGVFIPTVALYNDNPHDYPFWAEFHPVPISHGTTEKGILKARFETFTNEEFERIDKHLEEVNSLEEGTHKVEKTTSGWKDYPNLEIGNMSKMKGFEEI